MMGENMISNTTWLGHWIWMIVVAVVVVIPIWRICYRTGYPGWIGIMILIPFVNLALLYFIAFANWPREKSQGKHD